MLVSDLLGMADITCVAMIILGTAYYSLNEEMFHTVLTTTGVIVSGLWFIFICNTLCRPSTHKTPDRTDGW